MANSNKSDPNTYMRFEKATVDGEDIPAIVLHTPGFILLQSPNIRAFVDNVDITWNEDDNSWTEEFMFDGKKITKTHQLTVINKGSDSEEVTGLTLSDGTTFSFKNWSV